MDSLAPSPRLLSWLRSSAPGRPGLRVERLEDRTVPSSSISLEGIGWTPLGGTIVNGNPSQPGLPVAGRVTSIATPSIPFNPANPGFTGPTDPNDPNFGAFNTVYAGLPGGGVAQSFNGGQTWTFLTDNLSTAEWGGDDSNRNLKVGAVAVSPYDPNLLFAGLGERVATLGNAVSETGNGLLNPPTFTSQLIGAPPPGGTGTGLLRGVRTVVDGQLVVTWQLLKGPGNAFNNATFDKFVFHPTNPNIIFTVKNNGAAPGVYRSLDAGLNWENIVGNVPDGASGTFTDFILDPTNPAVGYVAASQATNNLRGVFRTANLETGTPGVPTDPAALTYTLVIGGSGTQAPGGSLVTVKLAFGVGTPSQPSRIYALSAAARAGGSINQFSDQLFRSDDSGINFRRLDPLPGPNFAPSFANLNLELLADPTTPNRIFIGGRGAGSVQILLNADYDPTPGSGQTPQYVNLTLPSTIPTTTQVIRDMRFDNTGAKDGTGRPVSPGRLIIATDAGLYRYQAPGGGVTTAANYTGNSLELVSLNGAPGPSALFIGEYFSTALSPQTDNVTIGGSFLNGQAIFTDNGPFGPASPDPAERANYNSLYFWQAPTGAATNAETRGTGGNIVINQLDPNLVYRVSNFTNPPYRVENVDNGGLFQRSTDGGQTWTTSVGGIVAPELVTYNVPFIADPSPQIGTNEARLYLGTNVVHRSNDGGQTWAPYGPDAAGTIPFVATGNTVNRPRVTAIGVGRAQPNRIYVAINDRRFGSPEGSFGPAIYTYAPGEVPSFPFNPVQPNNYLDVSPGNTGGPFLPGTATPPAPTSQGSNMTTPATNDLNPAGGPRREVRQLIVDPTDEFIVYAITTSTGAGRIFRTADGGGNWTDITGDLPGAGAGPGLSVFSIAQDPNRLTVTGGAEFNPQDDDLYIGTTQGVWKLSDPTQPGATGDFDWQRLGGTGTDTEDGRTGTDSQAGSMPDTRVFDVELNTTTGVLSAATLGRGIWQYQIRPFIRGQVYLDQTGNGTLQAPPDSKLGGAVILAIDIGTNPGNPNQFANTTTTPNGEYVFRSLPSTPTDDGNFNFFPADASTKLVDPATKYYVTGPVQNRDVTAATTESGVDLFVFDRVSISGNVYTDSNGNGVRDGGETGVPGLAVVLTAPAGTLAPTATPVATVTTDALGNYVFDGVGPLRPSALDPLLAPGAKEPFADGYQVVLTVPAGFSTTQTPGKTGVVLSSQDLTDANEAQTRIGVFRFGRLSGTVFDDFNGDGTQQPGELLLSGFEVQLQDLAGNVLTSTTTTDGTYTFGDFVTGLTAGTYRIVVLPEPGFAQTTADFAPFTITSGATTGGLNIGQFAQSVISGVLYEDVNANGVQDANEVVLVPGLEVSLIDPRTNTAVATTTTDALGSYAFPGLFPLERPGNTVPFVLRFTNPTSVYTQTSSDFTVPVTSGTVFTQINLGVFRNTTVSGFAFDDTNGDGTRQTNEPGLSNGQVSLLNSQTGAVVYTTVTDAAGNFVFPSVGPIRGNVPFRVGAPTAGFVQTTPNPPDFTLQSGTPVGGFVIGLFRTVVFSGVAFEDLNGDGAFNPANEPVLAGVTVGARRPDLTIVTTAVTGPDGAYTLTVGPGQFQVVQFPVAGFVETTAAKAAVTVVSGQRVPDQNFGNFRLLTVSGRAFNDLNGNGNGAGDPGLSGVRVQLFSAAGALLQEVTTGADGSYTFTGVGPGAKTLRATGGAGRVSTTAAERAFGTTSGTPVVIDFGFFAQSTIAGTVFEDNDRSGTVSAGDGSPSGITVQLLGAGDAVLAAAATVNGAYSFPNLQPGSYRVRAVPPAEFTLIVNGIQTFTVTSGQTVTPAPIGVLRLGSVAGTVFLDPNRNNRREGQEPGLAGAVVGLFLNNTQVATQTTGADGAYRFLGLEPATYNVRIVGNPTGFTPTAGGSRIVTLTTGSANPTTAVTGIDFGLTGRDRYALAADGGGGPRVQVYDALSNSLLQDFFVYEQTFTGGVRVATGDVNGDGTDDLIVVPGKGGGPRVRVLDGVTQQPIYDYFAYEPTFRNGLFVTSADVNGDGFSDLITGTESGGGPRVTVFSGRSGTILADYFAFDANFRGGVRVGTGDVDGDGVAEILTAKGPGGDSQVVSWSLLSGQPVPVSSFLAFDPAYVGGIYVAGSTTGPDGRSTIVVGSGILSASTGVPTAVVRVFEAASSTPTAEIEAFPGGVDPAGYRSEVRVASFDRTGDGIPDIAVANGPNSYPRFRFLDGSNRRPIGDESQPYEFGFTGGIFVG